MKSIIGCFALCLFTTPAFALDTRPCQGAEGSFRPNTDGSAGGFVASTATVSAESTLSTEVQICDYASLKGAVKVVDRAYIGGRADLRGNIAVSGGVRISGEATLINTDFGGDMLIMDDARIYGSAFLRGSVTVSDTSEVFGRAQVLDFAEVHGASKLCGNSILSDIAVITDDVTRCAAKTTMHKGKK